MDPLGRAVRESPLQRQVRQQAVVAELGQRALEGMALPQLAELAVMRVAEGLPARFASVLELQEGGHSLRLIARYGWRPGEVVIGAERHSQAGHTLACGEPVVVEDYATEKRFAIPDIVREHRARSGISAVIGSPDQPFGVLGAHRHEPARFGDEEANFMRSVANVLGAAVQRAHSEEALRASEQRYRSVVEQVSDGIVLTDASGRFLEANPRACEMLGLGRARLSGLRVDELLVPDEAGGPRGLSQLGGSAPVLVRRKLRRRDGGVLPVEIHANVLADGRVLAVLRDVTEREAAEAALRETSERFRHALRAMQAGAWELDLRTDQVVWSEESYELLGLQPARAVASVDTWLRAIHPADRERVRRCVADCVAERRDLEVEFRVRWPDGTERWIHNVGTLECDPTGSPKRFYGVQRDVTERHQAESARAEAEERYRAAQKMEAIGRLAGGVAHDFNNLLTSIIGYTELAMRSFSEDDERREDLAEVLRASDVAKELTRRLLAFARRRPVSSVVVPVLDGLRQVESLLRSTVGDDVELEIVPADEPLWIRIDPGQLAQLMLNLCVNAREAMPEGGRVRIELSSLETEGHDGSRQRWARLLVIDSGVGVPADAIDRVFEPFFTTKGELGTGLGLATCYGIVSQFGGDVRLTSRVGEGTTVEVRLPAVAPPRTSPAQPEARTKPRWRPTGTVLVVEDRAAIREMISRTLAGAGLEVVAAPTAESALELVHEREASVDLLVTDVMLPGQSGVDLARSLRIQGGNPRVLYVSGFTGEACDAPFSALSEHEAFLAKPFSAEELLGKLARAFGLAPG